MSSAIQTQADHQIGETGKVSRRLKVVGQAAPGGKSDAPGSESCLRSDAAGPRSHGPIRTIWKFSEPGLRGTPVRSSHHNLPMSDRQHRTVCGMCSCTATPVVNRDTCGTQRIRTAISERGAAICQPQGSGFESLVRSQILITRSALGQPLGRALDSSCKAT